MTLIEMREYFGNFRVVYLVQNEIDYVKVGSTKSLTERLNVIKSSGGLNLKLLSCSFLLEKGLACEIEKSVLKHFEKQKGIGEWLRADYKEVYNYANTVTEMCLFSVNYVSHCSPFVFEKMLTQYQLQKKGW